MAATKTTAASTPIAAGVRTPGQGAFSDPAKIGAMIQQMYPEYQGFDTTAIGQRWIDVHTPAPATGGAGAGTDVLQAPDGTTSNVVNPSVPQIGNGNNQMNKTMKPGKTQDPEPVSLTQGLSALQPNVTSLTGGNTPGYMLGGGNTLYSAPQIQPKPQPQPSLPTSTFDISKVRF